MGTKDQTHCLRGHEFTLENTGRYRGRRYCRICNRVKFRTWLDGEGKKADRARYWLKWKYKLSPDDFQLLLQNQGNCCALCKKPFSDEKGMDPVIDHCHATKRNRGILHRVCNMALGLLQEDAVTCRLAAEYIEHFRK